jgi:hypothetical protein
MRGGRRTWWQWTAAAAVALTVVAVLGRRDAPSSIRLPDGSTVVLQGVTYGTTHYRPPQWLNWLLHRLPVWRVERFGLNPPVVFTTARPELMLWLEHRRVTNAASAIRFSVADGDGFEAGVDALADQTTPLLPGLPSDRATTTFLVPVYPRREPRLRLNVYDPSRTRWLGCLTFAVPRDGPYPEWTPEPLPVKRPIGDCELVLERLSVSRLPVVRGAGANGPWASLATARFRTSRGEVPTHGWRVERLTLEDATGNRVVSVEVADWRTVFGESNPAAYAEPPSVEWWDGLLGAELRRRTREVFRAERAALLLTPRSGGVVPQRFHASAGEGDDEAVTFRWPLWHHETAYKLNVEFAPRAQAEFAPGQRLRLTGIPAPTPDALSSIGIRTNLGGYDLEVLALVGENATLPGREKDVHGQTTLELKVAALPDNLRFAVVSLLDDQGRLAEPRMVVPRESYGYAIAADARTVDITLAIFPRRQAAFLVEPTLAW